MIFNFISKSFGHVARLAGGGALALALVSCGGGGGSPGASSGSSSSSGGTTTTVNAAAITLAFSSKQITTTSTTPITVTATAVDANNVGLANVKVQFSADSGILAATASPVVTNSSGTVTATLTIGTNTNPRNIHVTVTGGGQTATGTVAVVAQTVTALAETFSSNQITNTTTSPITITAIAVDANNNGMPNVEVDFSADSGVITPSASPSLTNASGMATASLVLGANINPRTIHVTATGGGQTTTGIVTVVGTVNQTPKINLLFSSPTLPSAGTAAGAVTVTAQVQDPNNNALPGVPVTFTADSGLLVVNQATSGASGLATATLNTGGDPTNRVINIVASGGGASAASAINVTGTTITVASAPTSLTTGALSKFSFNLQDSSGKNLPNVPVAFSSSIGIAPSKDTIVGDPKGAGTPAAPVTDINGNFTLDVTPSIGGADTLTVSADGATASTSFNITNQSLTVSLKDITTTPPTVLNGNSQAPAEYTNSSCIAVDANYTVGGAGATGNAVVATSRGTLYTDSKCTSPYTASSIPFDSSGNMTRLYLSSITIGTATVTISEVSSGNVAGPTQTAAVTFIAQLTSQYAANLTLNASQTLVSANTNSVNPTAQYSIVTATVRDGSPQNNLVQGVPVQFQLTADASGGKISPSVVVTQANGQASTFYYPGSGTTAQNGVNITATIQSAVAPASKQIQLTVGGAAVFVSVGTGNTLSATSDATSYQQVWAVYVTDANGNPVVGATVNGQFDATTYTKGNMKYFTSLTPATWAIDPTTQPGDGFNLAGTSSGVWCPNTDTANNGVYSPVTPALIVYPNPYPANPSLAGTAYPHVMPGIPGNVTSSGVTDSNGYATVTITYPKDHAYWTNAKLTVTAFGLGTQSSATAFIQPLLGLTGDYANAANVPPGQTSPYGVNKCGWAF